MDDTLSYAAPDQAALNGQFGDYLVMYLALTDPEAANANAEELTADCALDDGNSRSYLYARLYAQKCTNNR